MGAELSIPYTEALFAGIKPYEGSMCNAKRLLSAINVEVTPQGLVGAEDLTLPFASLPEDISFPFPQLFFGKSVTLLAYASNIYEVDTSGGVGSWTASLLTVYDTSDKVTQALFNAGTEPWHFVDCEDYWYLICPTAIIFKTHWTGLLAEDSGDAIFCHTELPLQTGLYTRGRIMIGGFAEHSAEANVWNATWGSLFTNWLTDATIAPSYNVASTAPNERYVMWSSIGGGDVPLMLIFPEFVSTPGPLAGTTGYSKDEPWIFGRLRRGEIGWMPMPFQGRVMELKALGNDVVAYCENGIALLYKVMSSFPTYGCKILSYTGLLSRGAVCGDESKHIFLDQQGELYTLSRDGISPLGFVDNFNTYVGGTVLINEVVKGIKKKYYLSSSSSINGTYVLTSNGMSSITNQYQITSCAFTESTLIGIFNEHNTYVRCLASFTTEPFDMGFRGIKTITRIKFGLTTGTGTYTKTAIVYYKESVTDSFTSAGSFTLDEEGVANDIRIGGVEFKVGLSVFDETNTVKGYEGFSCSYIDIDYQIIDRRWRRGI